MSAPLIAQNFLTAVNFLKWPIDPVTVGAGETGTASAAGLQSFTFNPAHVNQVNAWEIFYNRQSLGKYLPDDFSSFISGATYRWKEKHTLAIYWRRFGFGETVRTDRQGNIVERFEPYDRAISLVYGRKLRDNLLGGVTLKYLRSSLGPVSDDSWAFDLGVNWINLFRFLTVEIPGGKYLSLEEIQRPDNFRGLNIGAALLNAGPNIVYIDEDQADPLPQRLRIGLAYKVISSSIISLVGLFDFEKELVRKSGRDVDAFYQAWFTGWKGKTFQEAIYHFGVELKLISLLSFHYGYRYEPFQEFFEKGVSTIGFGVDLKYFSLHYGKWIDKDNISNLNRDSYVLGISIGNIGF